MGRGDNRKYPKEDVDEIVKKIGFTPERVNGKKKGKGDHTVMAHSDCPDLKINIPTRDLAENELSSICSTVVIAMHILGLNTSCFKNKEGVEGKFMKSAKQLKKDPEALFKPPVRKMLGLNDGEDVVRYINDTKRRVQEKMKNKKQ